MKLKSPQGDIKNIKIPLEITSKLQAGWVEFKEEVKVKEPIKTSKNKK